MIRNNKLSPHPHSRFLRGFLGWAGKCQIVVQNQPTGFARLWADFFAYSNTDSNNHSLKTCYINGIQGCEPILADEKGLVKLFFRDDPTAIIDLAVRRKSFIGGSYDEHETQLLEPSVCRFTACGHVGNADHHGLCR